MKFRLTFIVLVLSLPFIMGFGGGGGNLVLIQKTDLQSFVSLGDLDIKPVLKGEGWLLANSPTREIDIIRQSGFDIRIVDDTPWSDQYYIVSGPRGTYPAGIPSSYREIARVPEGIIVEGYDENIEDFYSYDLNFAKIHDREIPIIEKSLGKARELPLGWFGPENSVVSQVSDSTITDWCYRLEAFRTRYSCTDSVTASSQWIVDKFTEFGYTDVSLDTFPFPPFSCSEQWNVVCVKPGTILPDRVIVIGGHYDSVTYDSGCDPDTLAPGVDDDGSGTVVTLEIARILANVDTDVTLMFVPFAAEEQGLYGSYYAAEQAYNLGTDVLMMLNMDMVANSDSYWDAEINTGNASSPFAPVFSAMAANYTSLIPFISYGASAGSDHYPFFQYGFDYVYLMEGDFSPQWHRCEDTVENINLPYLADMARMATASILNIANTPSMPAGFTATNVGDGTSLYLSWDSNPETDLDGYNIYYGTESGVYDSTKVVASSAVDDTLKNLTEGTTLYLTITAFDADGFESMYAEEVVITPDATPQAPTGLSSISFATAVILEWDRNLGELDIAGYNIYREVIGVPRAQDLLGYVPDPLTVFPDNTADPHVMYSYYVTAVDTQIPPNESDPSSEVRGRLSTHDMGILIIDNTRDGTGAPFMPTDEDVDLFYDAVLSGYNVTAHWDVSDSTTASRAIMDYDVGVYSTVVWHGDVRLGTPMAPDTTVMRMFLETGGNLWLSGWMLMASLSGQGGSNYVFGSGDFVSDYVGVDSARVTSNGQTDFIGARGVEPGFPSVVINPTKVPLGGLFSLDVLLDPFGGSYELYTYVSSDSAGSLEHGKAVGVASSSTAYGLVVTDFPLFFLEAGSADALAGAVMDMFEEVVGIGEDELTRVPLSYALSQNYPNPFNPMTTIRYEIPEPEEGGKAGEKVLTRLSIFDVRGRLVKVLVEEELEPGRYQVSWDGKNAEGVGVSSGIYFYRIHSGSFTSTRKMTVTK